MDDTPGVSVPLGRGDPNERCWSMTGSRRHPSSGRIGRSRGPVGSTV